MPLRFANKIDRERIGIALIAGIRDHEEYGHVGVDDRPESKERPKLHRIY